jgi:peptidoglycan/LPS O-acetylase OafA/YrhL
MAKAATHRSDIDGLRSLAILPILLFHAGVATLHGGFMGVDVFFVISGYLITGIIARDVDTARFQILVFYKRRIVRIFPALLAMVIVVLCAAIFLQLPNELAETSLTGGLAALSVSNLYFWTHTSYFAGDSETKAFLHTWSLGVEEQFYLFFPLGLILIKRFFAKWRLALLAGITALSFALDLRWGLMASPTGFYMLPARAWELGLGGLAALGAFPLLRSSSARSAAAMLGLAMVLGTILSVEATWAVPAPWAAIAVIGTALLLVYGSDGPTAKLFGLAPFRLVGLASYSIYLWHWPVMAFWRLEYGNDSTIATVSLLTVTSLVAGFLSWHFIERPSRSWLPQFTARKVVLGGIAAAGLVAVASLIVVQSPEHWRTHNSSALAVAKFADYHKNNPDYARQYRAQQCFARFEFQTFDADSCLARSTVAPNVLLLGDSHAAQYYLALHEALPASNLMQVTASGCFPYLQHPGSPWCTRLMDRVFKTELASPGIATVIMAARWNDADAEHLREAIQAFKARGIAVVVIGPINEYDGSFPLLYARAIERGDPSSVQSLIQAERAVLDRKLKPIVEGAGGQYYSVIERECSEAGCILQTAPNQPLHTDYGHVTLAGSRILMDGISNVVTLATKRQAED